MVRCVAQTEQKVKTVNHKRKKINYQTRGIICFFIKHIRIIEWVGRDL